MNYRRLFVENSCVFITIVVNNRIPIIIDNINLIYDAFSNVSNFYNFELLAYCIQKDHIHCIIKPENINEYPKIIKSFKYSFTKNIKLINPTCGRIWQNRYWEHSIINEEDLYKHLDYIHYNSMKHYKVEPKNWKYSSFNKFVDEGLYEFDWCNFDDKHKINDMVIE